MVYAYYVLNGQESKGEIMKNFKKISATALAMLAVSASLAGAADNALSVTASADDVKYNEGDFNYSVNEDGETVTVRGYVGKDTEAVIPSTLGGKKVTEIGYSAFGGHYTYSSSLESVVIPEGVTVINEMAFDRSPGIKNITLPNSLATIGKKAFAETSLTDVTIPDNVTTIGDDIFCACSSIASITVGENNKNFRSIDGILFNSDMTELICYPYAKENESYEIPDGVTTIRTGAVSCMSLKSITMPKSVTTVCSEGFAGSISLETVNYGGSKSDWEAIRIDDYYNDCLTDAKIICTDGVFNESEPATSAPAESTVVPGDTGADEDKQETISATLKSVDSENGLSGEQLEKQLFGDSGWTWQQVEKIEFASDKLFSVQYTAADGTNKTLGEQTAARAEDDGIWNTEWTFDTSLMSKDKPFVKLIAKDGTADITAKLYIKKDAEKPSNSDQKSTGIALATAPAVLAASAVVAVSKKRK